jgi:hypothetical protein
MDISHVKWRKASYSNNGANCVEVGVAHTPEGDRFLVRDTKDRTGGILAFTTAEWDAFIAGAKDGEFDRSGF